MVMIKIPDGSGNWIDFPTIKGDKGSPFKFEDFTFEQLNQLRGARGLSGLAIQKEAPLEEVVWLDTTADYPPLENLMGPRGPEGSRGPKGEQGEAGRDGLNGNDGYTPVKGIDYRDGIDGLDGTDGVKGDKGEQGIQGPRGLRGSPGIDGNDAQVNKENTIAAIGYNPIKTVNSLEPDVHGNVEIRGIFGDDIEHIRQEVNKLKEQIYLLEKELESKK